MRSVRLVPAILLCAASTVFAREPVRDTLNAVHVRAGAIVLDCRDLHAPSLGAVGAVLETNNAALLFGERERLMHTALRYCLRGAPSVAFVRDATAAAPVLALAH